MKLTCANLFVLSLAAVTSNAHSQVCNQWESLAQASGIPGVSGAVTAATVWDSDGAGPLRAELVVGGILSLAGNAPARTIAAWNGSTWRSLDGMSQGDSIACIDLRTCSASEIKQLFTLDGALVATGGFNINGQPAHIAVYRDGGWAALGGGLNFDVTAAAVIDGLGNGGQVIASTREGTFVFDGNQWVQRTFIFEDVQAMLSHDGVIFRAGSFQDPAFPITQQAVSRWNGSSWEPLWFEIGGARGKALAVFEGSLYVATDPVANSSQPRGGQVFRWLGGRAWERVGGAFRGSLNTLGVHEGKLYVGGSYPDIETGELLWNVAVLEEGVWVGIGETPSAMRGPGVGGLQVYELASYQGGLIVGGEFTSAGTLAVSNIASFENDQWRALGPQGPNGGVIAAADSSLGLVVAGNFTSFIGTNAKGVAVWRGAAGWGSLGSGLEPPVGDVEPYRNGVVTLGGGDELNANPTQVRYFDGTSWIPLGGPLGNGLLIDAYYDLEVVNGELYALGLYPQTFSGTENAPLLRWNGTDWEAPIILPGFSTGWAIEMFEGEMILGGANLSPDGLTQPSVARVSLNDGIVTPLGEDTAGVVFDLAVYRGELYATGLQLLRGDFRQSLIKWNGQAWSVVGEGIGGIGFSMAVYGDTLMIAGSFLALGETPLPSTNVVRWDGERFLAVGEGLGTSRTEAVRDLDVVAGELYAAGAFLTSGNLVTPYIARWRDCVEVCVGDFDQSGGVDGADVEAFYTTFVTGEPEGDVNQDGGVDGADIEFFFVRWEAGC